MLGKYIPKNLKNFFLIGGVFILALGIYLLFFNNSVSPDLKDTKSQPKVNETTTPAVFDPNKDRIDEVIQLDLQTRRVVESYSQNGDYRKVAKDNGIVLDNDMVLFRLYLSESPDKVRNDLEASGMTIKAVYDSTKSVVGLVHIKNVLKVTSLPFVKGVITLKSYED